MSLVYCLDTNVLIEPWKVAIPDVCDAFEVPWMNDFQFLAEIGITFSVSRR